MTAKTRADLRALRAWPLGDWVLHVPVDGDQRVVRVELPSYTPDEARHIAGNVATLPKLLSKTVP
jgi:hypothetical protein